MQSKEVKKWQDEEALKRYQMIAPLLDEDLDVAKRRQLREEIAEKNGYPKEVCTGMKPSTGRKPLEVFDR